MDNPDIEETLNAQRTEKIYELADKLVDFLDLENSQVSPAELLAAFALASAGLIVSFPSVEGNPLKAFDLAKAHNELFIKSLGEMLMIVVAERAHAKASEA